MVNMMSLSTRFAEDARYLGKLAQEGELGEIYYARARSIRRSGIPDWSLGFIQQGGGAFRDMGVHVLDSVWWLLGMPKPVSVMGVSGAKFGPRGQGYWHFRPQKEEFYTQYAADDYAGGFIRFENGIGLQVESFWASHQPKRVADRAVWHRGGRAASPDQALQDGQQRAAGHRGRTAEGPKPWDNIAEHFIACILDGVECQAPLRHGLIVQEMMEALLKSAETGKRSGSDDTVS